MQDDAGQPSRKRWEVTIEEILAALPEDGSTVTPEALAEALAEALGLDGAKAVRSAVRAALARLSGIRTRHDNKGLAIGFERVVVGAPEGHHGNHGNGDCRDHGNSDRGHPAPPGGGVTEIPPPFPEGGKGGEGDFRDGLSPPGSVVHGGSASRDFRDGRAR